MNQELPPGIDEPPTGAETTAVAPEPETAQPVQNPVDQVEASIRKAAEDYAVAEATDQREALRFWRQSIKTLADGGSLDQSEVHELIEAGITLGMTRESVGEIAREDVQALQKFSELTQEANLLEADSQENRERMKAAREELKELPRRGVEIRRRISQAEDQIRRLMVVRQFDLPEIAKRHPRLFDQDEP